jgi:hypothetical protein
MGLWIQSTGIRYDLAFWVWQCRSRGVVEGRLDQPRRDPGQTQEPANLSTHPGSARHQPPRATTIQAAATQRLTRSPINRKNPLEPGRNPGMNAHRTFSLSLINASQISS